jgi:hypothetical protein
MKEHQSNFPGPFEEPVPRIRLCIVTATPELLYEAVMFAAENASRGFVLHVFANECSPALDRMDHPAILHTTIQEVEENVGCTKGMHILWWRHLKGKLDPDDLVVYIHDDLNILEKGWDERVRRLFVSRPNAMLAGFGGAQILGDARALYHTPYELHQLARFRFGSNMVNAQAHGRVVTEEEQVATLDSFTLILRSTFLDEIEGWDWWPYPCHNFDNAVSCESRKRGYETWLIPVHVHHKGGETSCRPMYQEWAKKKFGGDAKVHADSHLLLYERYRGVLPIQI